jgi:hypothetical protein
MYEDFEDLRDNCPARIKADIAMDIEHDNPARLAAIWVATGDDEFRLHLNQAVSDFWEKEVRAQGGDTVPEDAFAIEIVIDSFTDQEMGSTLYLDLQAYCGTETIGELTWKIFEDDKIERRFSQAMATRVLGAVTSTAGMVCDVEVTEVEEL